MNESSLTKDRRLPSPYTSESFHPDQRDTETAISDQNGRSLNGHLHLRTCCRKRYPPVVLRMSLLPVAAFCRQATPAITSPPEPEPLPTSPSLAEYKPLDPREKFRIATRSMAYPNLAVSLASTFHPQGILAGSRTELFMQTQIETGIGFF